MAQNEIHMFVDGGAIACDVNIWDGEVHSVTENFDNVDCDNCRLKYGEYVIGQLKQQVEDLKEQLSDAKELNVSYENENRRQRTKLRDTVLELNNERRSNDRLVRERDELLRQIRAMQRRAQGYDYLRF